MTPEKRRFFYVALVTYTLVMVIGALNYSFTDHAFASISEAVKSMHETEVVGAYLLVVVLSLLLFLSKQEERTLRRLPKFLEERTRSITPMDKRCPKCNITVGFGIDICPQDGTPLTFAGDESESFGSSYEFLEEIARGGMCVLYKARHRLLKKVVAIKMLDTRLVGQEHAAERFVYEARAASNLHHGNIVSVLDFGQFESEKLFLVMEYLPGCTLGSIVAKSDNGLPVEDCLDVFNQVCDAMFYAHTQKILHRDLKPSNIMVNEQNGKYDVKIVDFGIAKLLEGTVSNLTKTGDVFGTPDYMSPEQCMGQAMDARSDIYSMGCLMYEALTGERPACSEGALATMYKQINDTPQPLHVMRPELAQVPQLQAIVSKALAKAPEERYGSFDELRTALRTVSYVTQAS
jgi:serine/threonine-protein kinase